jgi:cupin fold WbuC family metalloprotein
MPSIPGFRCVSDAVFETESDPVSVDEAQLAALIDAARAAPQGRARLLLHPDRSDGLHEMVIALPPTSCDRPHINCKSGKSFVALSGRFAVMCFSDDGATATPIVLSAPTLPGSRMVRLRRPIWHTIIPLDGDVVFLETISGPFAGNCFAPWFPEEKSTSYPDAAERLRKIARHSIPVLP